MQPSGGLVNTHERGADVTKRRPIEERFWPKVKDAGALECWEWTAATSHGYGVFADRRKNLRAHRVAYELMIGPIPPLLVLDHLCKNRLCVNPYHLDPVPLAVNSARTNAGEVNAARQRARTHCIRGHDYSDPAVLILTSAGYRVCRICKSWRRRTIVPQKTGQRPKLQREDVVGVDGLRTAGVSVARIAEHYQVDVTTIYSALKRKGAYALIPREAA